MQTTMTMIPPSLSSLPPMTSISHLESVVIAPQSERSPEPSPEFGSSPIFPLSMRSLQPPPRLPWQIRPFPQSTIQDHRVPPLRSTSPLLTTMATPSRTRASAREGSWQTNHFRQQTTRFLQTVPHVEMKMRPKTRVLAVRLSKHSSHFSSSSVGASLHSYFRTAALVKNVLINAVTKSRLKSCTQPSNDSRVLPPLDHPTDAMEELSPKANVIQIAHPFHPPKEPDKARHCQVVLYSPLKKARLHLEFIPHYVTFAMDVFNSYGSRRNILVHDVFAKRQKREIAHVPHLLFLTANVPHAIEIILVFETTFLTGTFGGVSMCVVDSFAQMMGKAPKWTGNFFGRERSQGLHPGSFLCPPIPQLFCRDQPNLKEDAVIPITAIRRQFFGYMLICSSICTCLQTMRGKDVVVHQFYFDLVLLLPEYGVGLNDISFWEQFLLCIHLTSADIAYGIFTQRYFGFLMFTELVIWMTDAILQYWNAYMHAVLACVALALFSMYKLEPILVASELVKETYSCYFQKFPSMALSLAVGTEPLDGLFTINSNPFKLETFENMLVTWVTQPTAPFLLDGMHYHGVMNMAVMAFLSASQRLLQVIEHFDGAEYVSWCHFNATCNVDLLAALFVAHMAHIHVMERFLPGLTTYIGPAQVLPLIPILVHCLVLHFHKLESDHISLGMRNQVAATYINCMQNWLTLNILFAATWFMSLITWSEVLSINFAVADLFSHMRAILDFGRWFHLVYKEIITNGWKWYYVRQECNHNTLWIALALMNMIHILYGEEIQTLLSRGGQGSNNTEWKTNAYLIPLFTYAVQSNESAVIWFLTSHSSSAAWIRHVYSVVDQMTNPFDSEPKCFDYWKGLADLALFLQHKIATYRMLGADSLLYFRDYQAIQSSMEFLKWWEIPSTFFGVLLNNNWPSLTKLGVFLFTMVSLSLPIVHNWVCNL